jgi:hypothetical protein
MVMIPGHRGITKKFFKLKSVGLPAGGGVERGPWPYRRHCHSHPIQYVLAWGGGEGFSSVFTISVTRRKNVFVSHIFYWYEKNRHFLLEEFTMNSTDIMH